MTDDTEYGVYPDANLEDRIDDTLDTDYGMLKASPGGKVEAVICIAMDDEIPADELADAMLKAVELRNDGYDCLWSDDNDGEVR